MTTRAHPRPAPAPAVVPLWDVERELSRRLKAVQGLAEGQAEGPVLRACMSNLVIYCDGPELAAAVSGQVPDIVAAHPCRVLLLAAEPGPGDGDLTAEVAVRGNVVDPGRWVCSEQVTLRATGRSRERLPFALRSLLIGDLPTNLWWASSQPPALGGALMYELADPAQQVVYDSLGWTEPARGVLATSAWLEQIEREPGEGRWRVASDLSWRRLKYWRRLLAQALDPSTAPGALESVSEVLVEHGPHAVVQAWELVSWLASRLKWRVQDGQVQPGVEIAWHVTAPHGPVLVRIHRLAEGPAAVRRVRVACQLCGQPAALNVVVQDGHRLAVIPEGVPAAPRTMTVQSLALPELLGRQLSDREHDYVFHDAMRVAQVFARSVVPL